MKYSLQIGKVFGVRIYIHWTFLLLIGLIVISSLRKGFDVASIGWSVGLVLAVFACIVLHELGHAFTASKFDVKTNYILLLPIGGLAQLETIPENPKQELLIAVSGPAVNVIIAILLIPFINVHTLVGTESFTVPGVDNFLFFLATINVWLVLFNLIPAFPMDGGRILRALLAFWFQYSKATRIATIVGQAFAVLFFFAGFVYNPMLIIIGLFIFLSGQYESVKVQTSHFLHGFTVKDIVMHEIPTIENSSSIRDAEALLLGSQNKNFLVTNNGMPVGTITRDGIIKAKREKGEETLVGTVSNDTIAYVSEKMPLDEAWKIMQHDKTPFIVVKSDDHLTGMVDQENIAELILLKTDSPG